MLDHHQASTLAILMDCHLMTREEARSVVAFAYGLPTDKPEPAPSAVSPDQIALSQELYRQAQEHGVNPDAVLVANYFWKLPDNVYDALKYILHREKDYFVLGAEARILANHINNLPPDILAALKRILKID